jgi:hypothetical protein
VLFIGHSPRRFPFQVGAPTRLPQSRESERQAKRMAETRGLRVAKLCCILVRRAGGRMGIPSSEANAGLGSSSMISVACQSRGALS